MEFSLLVFLLVSALSGVLGAPAVSTVHVSFVSGNQATQYSHALDGDASSLHFNSLGAPGTEAETHTIKRRSATRRPLREPGGRGKLRSTTTTTTTVETPTVTTLLTTKITDSPAQGQTSIKSTSSRRREQKKKRVQFTRDASSTSPKLSSKVVLDPAKGDAVDDSLQLKDSKAVKRSPYPSENFGSFNFPDFDEFGGNEFGSLGNFGSGNTHHSPPRGGQLNAESLAPDGVFLPPIPTSASNHIDDPYLADAETAKYASQHPPYFHEFPHKRNVLALNEQREENGLEPNILRSIRPFFPFFEINNLGSPVSPFSYRPHYRHQSVSAPLILHDYSFLYDHDEPSVYYYAESQKLPKLTLPIPVNLYSKQIYN